MLRATVFILSILMFQIISITYGYMDTMQQSNVIYVPDDYSLLSQALSAITGNTTIYVRSGYYSEPGSIKVKDGPYIEIIGLGDVVIDLNGNNFTARSMKSVTIRNIEFRRGDIEILYSPVNIENVTVDRGIIYIYNTEANETVNLDGVTVKNTKIGIFLGRYNARIEAENITVLNCSNIGIKTSLSWGHLLLKNIYVQNCSVGVRIDIGNATIENSIIKYNNVGIYFPEYSVNNTIIDTIISNNSVGVLLDRNSWHNSLSSCAIEGNEIGVLINGTTLMGEYVIKIAGNLFRDNDIAVKHIYLVTPAYIYLSRFINNRELFVAYGKYENTLLNITPYTPTRIHYKYKGKIYWERLGNHYDTYTGIDRDGDGIGDTNIAYPYLHPLVRDPKEYVVMEGIEYTSLPIKINMSCLPSCTVKPGDEITIKFTILENPNTIDKNFTVYIQGTISLVSQLGIKGTIPMEIIATGLEEVFPNVKGLYKNVPLNNSIKLAVINIPKLYEGDKDYMLELSLKLPRDIGLGNYTINTTMIDILNQSNKLTYLLHIIVSEEETTTTEQLITTTTPQTAQPTSTATTTQPTWITGESPTATSQQPMGTADYTLPIVLLIIIVLVSAAAIMKLKRR